jgi:hypothetical protein
MMRELTSHRVNECNESLEIQVLDEPGAGGASHIYAVYGFHTGTNQPAQVHSATRDETCLKIAFQNGPIPSAGVNGVTQEALLAIIEDRLKSFQAGPYACRENALALTHIQEAMHWLHHRTRERLARGVECTHQE